MHAYVQVALDDAKESEIYETLKGYPEVQEVHILFGEWDINSQSLELTAPEAFRDFCHGQDPKHSRSKADFNNDHSKVKFFIKTKTFSYRYDNMRQA